MPYALLALAAASFCIGTTEFVIMGLLPEVAASLGVTIPQAGLLVTGYALGVVIGAPIVAAAVVAVPRKAALLGMVGVFVLGNLLCALAPNYGVLMGARVVTAFCHGAFFGIGSVVAADLVAPNRRASAIALMFGGLTVANVLGVPLGTAIGHAFGWRTTFFVVAGFAVLAAVAVACWLPRDLPLPHPDLRREIGVLRRTRVLLALGVSIVASATLFTVFTYIAPLLERDAHITPDGVTIALLIFGAGLTAGNFIGGRLGDRGPGRALIGVSVALIAVLFVFWLVQGSALAAQATMFVWGALSFAVVPLLQMQIVDAAAEAPNLASTLNQGAFNLGNASGAWIGGAALDAGAAYASLPLISVALAAAVCAGTIVLARSHAAAAARAA